MRRQRLFITATFALLCLVGWALLALTEPFFYVKIRNLYRDAIARGGRMAPVDSRLVFLAIDADSVNLDQTDLVEMYHVDREDGPERRALEVMAKRWPWPREVYALVISRLINSGARVVAFDLTFPTSSDADEELKAALDRYRDHVVVGSNFVDPSWSGHTRVGAILTRPAESLIEQTSPTDDRVGFTNFWPDTDDVVRRTQYAVTFEQVERRAPEAGSEVFWSLGAEALRKAGFASSVPSGLDNRIFRYAGRARAGFPPHSLFEIFLPDYWRHNFGNGAFFRDKIVVIGAEGNWQHDEHQTPFGSMPGPELHLNAMNAALQGEFITEVPPLTVILVTFLFALIAIAVSGAIRTPWLRFAAVVVLNAGAVILALYGYNHFGVFVPLVAPLGQLNFTVIFGLMSDVAAEQIEKKRVRRVFERYVSRGIVQQVLEQPEFTQSLGGVVRPVTVLFSDIRGYSLVAAHSEPQVLVNQLNEYLTAMVDCVFRFGGTLDKFIGDAVMAVWGNAQTTGARADALNAVRSAVAMRETLDQLNASWRGRGLCELHIGIAVNHGDVVVGNIGSPERMEFTVIGDAVNVTWKMQELTKELGHELVVGPRVRDFVSEHFDCRSVGRVTLRSVDQSTELFAISGPVTPPAGDLTAAPAGWHHADVSA